MPFTPFHLGPGTAIKAVLRDSFSLMVFGFAQVAMDLQPLIHMLLGQGIVHGISHSYVGATVIGALSVLVGRPLCQWLLGLWTPRPDDRKMLWLRGAPVISWRAAIVGASLGTYSHVLFDTVIHADVLPWAPFAANNPLLGSMSFGGMHLLCLGLGILGVIGLAVRYLVESA